MAAHTRAHLHAAAAALLYPQGWPWGRALGWWRRAAELATALPLPLAADLGEVLSSGAGAGVQGTGDSEEYAAFLRATAATPAARTAGLLKPGDLAVAALLAHLAQGAPVPTAYRLSAAEQPDHTAEALAAALASGAPTPEPRTPASFAPPDLLAHLLERLRALSAADIRFLHMLGSSVAGAADLADLRALTDLLALPPLAHELIDDVLAFLPALAEAPAEAAAQTYAIDGISGLARRGSLDMVLPVEWALPDDLLTYRFLNGELLYYGRERPPEQRNTLFLLLVQGGDAMAGDPDLLARAAALALARAALARGAVVQCAWFDNRLHPPQGLHSPKEIAAFVQQQQRGPVDLPRVLTAAREHVHALFSDFATIEIQWLLHAQSGTEHVSIIRELARQLRTRTGSSALFLSPGATPTEPPVLANVLASRWAALGSAALHDAEERAQAVRALRGLARPTRRETLLREKPAPRHRPRPEASTRAQQKAPRYVVGAHFQSKLEGHTHWLHSVAWAPDGTMLATASADTTVCLWHAADNILLHTLSGHSEAVRAVAWAPDGNILASASWDRTVRLWRVADGTLLHTLEGHNGWLYGVAWAPDAQTLATACEDTNIWLWRVADGTLARTLTGHSKRVNEVHWSSDGHMLASASDDKTVKLWRVADGVNQRTLEGHAGHVTAVAWAPDGQTLASASNDSTIRLWRVADGSTLRILRGHDKRVNSVAWAPDGQTLVSAAWDDTIRLWRVTDGTLIRTLTGHNSAVLSVAWAPDGQTLASAAWDLMVRLWRVEYE